MPEIGRQPPVRYQSRAATERVQFSRLALSHREARAAFFSTSPGTWSGPAARLFLNRPQVQRA